ncbi:MAG: hypothetical protein H6824_18660 [Planctomycetaceae bacterium]|nr:hypothetical protein [Planctomycetaceae bacterium]
MWQQTNLEGIELDLFEPQQLCDDGAIIYLHGHGGERLSENEEFTRLFEEAQLPVVAPRGGRSWWLDVPSSEFPHELTPVQFIKTKVVEEIQRRWGIEPPAIALLGVSMGGQGVLNIACRDGKRFPCVARAVSRHRLSRHLRSRIRDRRFVFVTRGSTATHRHVEFASSQLAKASVLRERSSGPPVAPRRGTTRQQAIFVRHSAYRRSHHLVGRPRMALLQCPGGKGNYIPQGVTAKRQLGVLT